MTTHHIMSSLYTWVCDMCGEKRSDIGPEETSRIQGRHACKESDMPEGKTVNLLCWEELDAVMDALMEVKAKADEAEAAILAAKARGMAEIMKWWTIPHFRTADAIAREAGLRWSARQRGEEHITLGTIVNRAGVDLDATAVREGRRPAGRTTQPAPAAAAPRRASTTPARPSVRNARAFTDEEVSSIKAGASNGFTVQMLAIAMKCKDSDIEAVLNGG